LSRHPGRPHLRHADLAQVRPDGSVWIAPSAVSGALARNNICRRLGGQGSMVSVNLIANTDF
jgi:hypothetical protein